MNDQLCYYFTRHFLCTIKLKSLKISSESLFFSFVKLLWISSCSVRFPLLHMNLYVNPKICKLRTHRNVKVLRFTINILRYKTKDFKVPTSVLPSHYTTELRSSYVNKTLLLNHWSHNLQVQWPEITFWSLHHRGL